MRFHLEIMLSANASARVQINTKCHIAPASLVLHQRLLFAIFDDALTCISFISKRNSQKIHKKHPENCHHKRFEINGKIQIFA